MRENYKTIYAGGEGEITEKKIPVYCDGAPGGKKRRTLLLS